MGIYFKATSVIGIQIIPHNQDQEADLHQQFSIVRHFFLKTPDLIVLKKLQICTTIIFVSHDF